MLSLGQRHKIILILADHLRQDALKYTPYINTAGGMVCSNAYSSEPDLTLLESVAVPVSSNISIKGCELLRPLTKEYTDLFGITTQVCEIVAAAQSFAVVLRLDLLKIGAPVQLEVPLPKINLGLGPDGKLVQQSEWQEIYNYYYSQVAHFDYNIARLLACIRSVGNGVSLAICGTTGHALSDRCIPSVIKVPMIVHGPNLPSAFPGLIQPADALPVLFGSPPPTYEVVNGLAGDIRYCTDGHSYYSVHSSGVEILENDFGEFYDEALFSRYRKWLLLNLL